MTRPKRDSRKVTSSRRQSRETRDMANEKARRFFEEMWKQGDPWDLSTSEFEKAKYDLEISILGGRHFDRVLEIGCGTGTFTRRIAPLSGKILALDISSTAIAGARKVAIDSSVEFREQNIIDFDLRSGEPWDLLVMSETIYYLGWLYPFFDVAWLAAELFGATREGGQLLMANTRGGVEDYLLRPWIIRTYHDLFRNVGYQIASEKVFRGMKNGVELEVVISLFEKPFQEVGT